MIDNRLLIVLNEIINTKKEELDFHYNNLFLNLEKLNKEVTSIIENQDLISKFDFSKLTESITISDGIIRTLKFYQKVSKSNFLELTEEQKQKIIENFIKFKELIDKKIKETMSLNEDYMTLSFEYYQLLSLKERINTNQFIKKEDFILFSKIIKDNINNINRCLELIKILALSACLDYEKENDIKTEQIVKITNLKKKELEELFLEFNINLNDFKEKDQNQLLLYGSLENIKNILTILKINNLKLNIENYSKKITQILLLSNQENINVIIDNIKEDLSNLADNEFKLNEIFEIYINTPSIFINGLKKYEIKSKEKGNKSITKEKNEFISGAFNNYLLNRQLFIDLGITNINEAIKSCSSVFTESNKKIKINIDYFESYGIDKKIYLSTLSSMRSSNPLDVIDQFIEAGCYDYIINCFSRTNLALNSEELYQLINAKKSNWSDKEIYRYAMVGDKKQKQRRASNLSKLSGDTLVGEPEYKIQLDNKFEDIDFQIQEPITDMVLNNHFIKTIEDNFKNDDLRYDFNGTIISRYKVLRYFAILLKNKLGSVESLKYAIFKNVIITKNEYDFINNSINFLFKTSKNYYRLENRYFDVNFQESSTINENLINNYFIKILEDNYKENDMSYNFEGIIIPRYDVLRNFSILLKNNKVMPNPLESLMYSIIKDRDLNSNQCYIIAKSLNSKHEGLMGEKKL